MHIPGSPQHQHPPQGGFCSVPSHALQDRQLQSLHAPMQQLQTPDQQLPLHSLQTYPRQPPHVPCPKKQMQPPGRVWRAWGTTSVRLRQIRPMAVQQGTRATSMRKCRSPPVANHREVPPAIAARAQRAPLPPPPMLNAASVQTDIRNSMISLQMVHRSPPGVSQCQHSQPGGLGCRISAVFSRALIFW